MKFLSLFLIFSCSPKYSRWGIQLQKYEAPYDLSRIAASDQELWVIDADEVKSTEVKALKATGKKVISYLSIGEAESYRNYFSGLDKKVLLKENPEWKGNFTVKYWELSWQATISQSLKQIIAKDFDGVFLDIIDAFDRFPDKEEKARQMAEFVIRLRQEAPPGFLIIAQNGTHIRRLLKEPNSYLAAIDGVNVENAIGDSETVDNIRFYQKHKKFVLSLEYPETEEETRKYFERARELNVFPLAAEKTLSGKLIFPEDK